MVINSLESLAVDIEENVDRTVRFYLGKLKEDLRREIDEHYYKTQERLKEIERIVKRIDERTWGYKATEQNVESIYEQIDVLNEKIDWIAKTLVSVGNEVLADIRERRGELFYFGKEEEEIEEDNNNDNSSDMNP